MSVNGWARQGGAFLGVRRYDAKKLNFEAISESLEKHKINAIMMIGKFLRIFLIFIFYFHIFKNKLPLNFNFNR